MPSLWFILPAHGRAKLTRICLKQLRRTCDALTADGVEATAVVIADDENLDTALELGFGTVHRDNQFVSRKFNDGIQVACDPNVNPRPADYVVPFGSDDWVDHRILLNLPPPDTLVGFKHFSFVREDGGELTEAVLRNEAGCGIRIYPVALMAPLGYRPADEDRERGCDTSILVNLREHHGDRMRVHHAETNPRQIVDWKTGGEQLNPYDYVLRRHRRYDTHADPFDALADIYPADALDEMRRHYAPTRSLVAA